MSASPAYHLRTNKAVDRLLLVETLRRVDRALPRSISKYTYVGLGGPYLEDFHLIHQAFDLGDMISLEMKSDVLTRQIMNRPNSCVELRHCSTKAFVENFTSRIKPYLIWFDYESPSWKEQIEEICDLLPKLPSLSIFKVSFPCSTNWLGGNTNQYKAERLSDIFGDFGPFDEQDVWKRNISTTLYSICRKAIATAVPDTRKRCVRSLASYSYDDGTLMLTITMIVGPLEAVYQVVQELSDWPFADSNWQGPKTIAVPSLSLRERFAVDRLLPGASARTIVNQLKLRFDRDYTGSIAVMENYVEFYRHVPQFVRTFV